MEKSKGFMITSFTIPAVFFSSGDYNNIWSLGVNLDGTGNCLLE